jgi:hypothetical protein
VGLASIVLDSIRDSDFAGRIGGDEFVIALVESTELATHLLLDRLRARLAHAELEQVVPVGTRISAGCAGFPHEADCAQDLLVLADRRLYDDKRARKAAESSAIPSINDVPVPPPVVAAQPATIEPGPGEAILFELEDDANERFDAQPAPEPVEDAETRRVVDAARQAIEEARRRSTESQPGP